MSRQPFGTAHISVERGTRRFESPVQRTHPLTVDPPGADDVFRGPVRLVVDMPLPRRALAKTWLWALGITTIVLLVLGLLATYVSGVFVYPAILVVMFVSSLAFGTAIYGTPTAKREILEVDSRFVTLRHDDKVVGAWGRRQFSDVHVVKVDARKAHRLGPASDLLGVIHWGSTEGISAWSAGSGITAETA